MQRITEMMTSQSVLEGIANSLDRLTTTTNEMSSGLRITKPSDDPYGASLAVSLKGQLNSLNTYSATANDATGVLSTTDGALSDINSVVQRVRELAVEGANGTYSQQDRDSAAQEVDQLTEQLKQTANTTYNGSYVFSGTATTTPPYQAGATDTYQGDSGTISREIAPGSSVQVNTNISQLLGNGSASGDGKLLDALRTVSADLRSGNTTALSNNDLASIDTNSATLQSMQANVGALTNRVTLAQSRIQSLQVSTTNELSSTQGADIAQTAIDYSTEQSAYTAALKAGSSIVQSSLLDFLGNS